MISRGKRAPLGLDLTLDLDPQGTQAITGIVSGEAQNSALVARRAPFDKNNPLPESFVQNFTFYLPPKYPSASQADPTAILKPHGNGIGTMSISSAGIVKWTGTLGDGTPASQSTAINAGKTWPLYVSLYKGTGYVGGEVTHDPNAAASDLSANLNWIKPAHPTDHMFPDGFVIEGTSLLGETYIAPARGVRVIPGYDTAAGNAGPLSLLDGNLAGAGIAKVLTLSTTNAASIAPPGLDKLKIAINAKAGTVSGSFVFPVTKKLTPIKGVILQNKIGKGVGIFTGSTISKTSLQTGRLNFAPAP
jgi:hypothetical protein